MKGHVRSYDASPVRSAWATGFIGAKYAMPHAEPFWFLALRFAIAGLILALFAMASRRPWPSPVCSSKCPYRRLAGARHLSGVRFLGYPQRLASGHVGFDRRPATNPDRNTCRSSDQRSGGQTALDRTGAGLIGVLLVLWPKLTLNSAGSTRRRSAPHSSQCSPSAAAQFGKRNRERLGSRDRNCASVCWSNACNRDPFASF